MASEGLLTGRVAVVTGAAQGIGRAVAEACAREGAKVAALDVAEARDVGALALRLDVTDPEATERAAERVAQELGEPWVVVANAGVLALHPAVDTPLATWRKVIDVNLTGAFLTATTFARRMVAAGQGGRISSPPRSSACAAGARTRPTAPPSSA
jgi:NAD(P)-dependent dehydrogenase (short-subunit alcohol dehydrogenase family)